MTGRLRGILFGALVMMVFSVWPFRLANALCCGGIIGGGAVAALQLGRSQGGRLDSVAGIAIGIRTGLVAALLALALNLALWISNLRLPGPNGYADAWPAFMFSFAEIMWDSLRNIASDPTISTADVDPTIFEHFVLTLIANVLFGALGGALGAASLPGDDPHASFATRLTRRAPKG